MEQVRRFFHRYVFSTAGILLLFFTVNLFLFIGLLCAIDLSGAKMDNFPISTFSEHVSVQNGTLSADSAALELLQQEKAWAMILDDAGTVIWEEDLPGQLPRSYSVSDVAVFSRWYLQDYPTTVWTRKDGLLVVGHQPGTILKYNLSTKMDYAFLMLAGTLAAFLMNLLLMLSLFIRNARRIERSIGPILNGIQALSEGKPCHLEEQGELAQICAGVNRAGAYLLQKDNTRAEWIRGISHDIRTPLSMILGYASEIEDSSNLPDTTRRQGAIIRKQGEKLKNLVEDLNLTTKLEYSMQPIHMQRMDPVELARQVISEILNDGLSDQYEIAFSEERPGKTAYLSGDSSLLRRMLGNLIRNSIIHNPAGCNITVSVGSSDTACFFTVADNGCGIHEPLLNSLNEDEDISSTQQADGNDHGLGLKIVRQIAKAHQGKAVFTNISPHGLSVKIILPLDCQNESLAPPGTPA